MAALRTTRKPVVRVLAAIAASVVAGCAGIGALTMMVKDAAGTTRFEASTLSLEEQFERFGKRYLRAQELLTEAQVQVSTDTWQWTGEAFAPAPETTSSSSLPGATRDNSYYLVTGRTIEIAGATGAREDTEPMVAYFRSKGWKPTVHKVYGEYHVLADTGEGYRLDYLLTPSGRYSIDVISDLFWGDYTDLLFATAGRVPDEAILTESVPGVFVPFPKWTDPIVRSRG